MQKALRLCLVIVGALFLPGCQSEPAEEASDELAPDTVAAAPTISLSDIAGTWDMRSVPVSGADTTSTVYQIQVTPEGVTYFLPDRDPIQAVAVASGDSIILDLGPFESVRRAGVMVSTHSVMRLEGDRLVGSIEAHYTTTDADSVLNLTSEGTRHP